MPVPYTLKRTRFGVSRRRPRNCRFPMNPAMTVKARRLDQRVSRKRWIKVVNRTLDMIDVLYERSTSRNSRMFKEYGIPYKPSTRARILVGKGSSGALYRR